MRNEYDERTCNNGLRRWSFGTLLSDETDGLCGHILFGFFWCCLVLGDVMQYSLIDAS